MQNVLKSACLRFDSGNIWAKLSIDRWQTKHLLSMYSTKIVFQVVTSVTICVSIKSHCRNHSPLNGNAQKVTCIIYWKCLCLIAVSSLSLTVFALAEVEVVVVVIIVVDIVVFCRHCSLSNQYSATLLWVQRFFFSLRGVYWATSKREINSTWQNKNLYTLVSNTVYQLS